MNPAELFLDALPTVPATYERDGIAFGMRISIAESDRAFKTSRRDELIAADIVGTCADDLRIRHGGRITTAVGIYRIDRITPSPVPGLLDLSLARLQGAAVPVFDASALIPLDEEILINGRPVRANINRSVETEEEGPNRTLVIVLRAMIAISEADADGIEPGAIVAFDRKQRRVVRVMRDGLGFVKLLA